MGYVGSYLYNRALTQNISMNVHDRLGSTVYGANEATKCGAYLDLLKAGLFQAFLS